MHCVRAGCARLERELDKLLKKEEERLYETNSTPALLCRSRAEKIPGTDSKDKSSWTQEAAAFAYHHTLNLARLLLSPASLALMNLRDNSFSSNTRSFPSRRYPRTVENVHDRVH